MVGHALRVEVDEDAQQLAEGGPDEAGGEAVRLVLDNVVERSPAQPHHQVQLLAALKQLAVLDHARVVQALH